MEALHAWIEVDQADGDTRDTDDRQAVPIALALDQPALLHVDIERSGEDVDAVESNLARHTDAVGGALARLGPCGIDQSQFHGIAPFPSNQSSHSAASASLGI